MAQLVPFVIPKFIFVGGAHTH